MTCRTGWATGPPRRCSGSALAGAGQPLGPSLRAEMEHRFGHDFAGVRVHAGDVAVESARAVQALAYTVGHDIVLGAGQDPDVTLGASRHDARARPRRGARHGAASPRGGSLVVGDVHDPAEHRADRLAEAAERVADPDAQRAVPRVGAGVGRGRPRSGGHGRAPAAGPRRNGAPRTGRPHTARVVRWRRSSPAGWRAPGSPPIEPA